MRLMGPFMREGLMHAPAIRDGYVDTARPPSRTLNTSASVATNVYGPALNERWAAELGDRASSSAAITGQGPARGRAQPSSSGPSSSASSSGSS